MKHYNRPEWRAFRTEVIRLHDGVCNRCQRGPDDGVTLQVHHNIYLPKRLPWQYPHESCEALCKGCHAQEHGKIMPQSGWSISATTMTLAVATASVSYVELQFATSSPFIIRNGERWKSAKSAVI